MTAQGWLQIAFYVVVLTALALARHLYGAGLPGRSRAPDPLLGPLERLIYRLLGVEPERQQDWKAYAQVDACLQRSCSGSRST